MFLNIFKICRSCGYLLGQVTHLAQFKVLRLPAIRANNMMVVLGVELVTDRIFMHVYSFNQLALFK